MAKGINVAKTVLAISMLLLAGCAHEGMTITKKVRVNNLDREIREAVECINASKYFKADISEIYDYDGLFIWITVRGIPKTGEDRLRDELDAIKKHK